MSNLDRSKYSKIAGVILICIGGIAPSVAKDLPRQQSIDSTSPSLDEQCSKQSSGLIEEVWSILKSKPTDFSVDYCRNPKFRKTIYDRTVDARYFDSEDGDRDFRNSQTTASIGHSSARGNTIGDTVSIDKYHTQENSTTRSPIDTLRGYKTTD